MEKPLLTLAMEPSDLRRRYRLSFDREFDDLDWYEIGAVDLRSGLHIHFRRYEGNPEPGTTAFVDGSVHLGTAIADVVEALNLEATDITWTAPRDD